MLTMFGRSNANPGSIRMTYLGNGEAPNIHNPLQSFLVAYTALALRLARIDNQTLAGHIEDPGAVPDLISNRYLASLHNLLAYGAPFWKSLVDLSRYDSKLTITAMISRFALSPANGVKCMTEMVEELFERSQKLPVLTQSLWVHINIAVRLIQHYRLLQRTGPIMEEALVIQLQELPSQVYQFFLALDHKLQTFISKQVSALSIETSQGLVLQLSTLLQHIARSDLELTHRIVEEDLCLIQRFDKEEAASIVELAWKFGLLKKCILEGRMEIRVQGVETMQLELVQIFQKHVQGSEGRKDHPVAQFLADFMLNNKLIEYFVGVDSHPQLINRCANIIGFLVVTDRYTEAESDTIWQAVTTSQDSRFIDALLNMLIGIFNISTYPILLYLIAKLNELPIHSFDSSMINYARTLLDHLRKTWKQIPGAHSGFQQKMDMPPFHLCIRLLRQCTAESSMDLNRKREIHLFATTELNYLLPSGPSDTDRRAIYEECITDISNRTEFTTGSVSAINALVAQDPQKQIQLLFKDSDLTSQLIGEFAHMINAERCLNTSPQILDDRLVCRSCLLEQIIARVPNTITADAGAQLWDFAVGSRALHDAARDYMWMCFCKAIRLCNSGDSRNSFIDQCIKTYLPQLQPRFYTNGCLCFVQDVNSYHLVFAASRTEENINEEPTAIDLLWQLSLTSPIGTIEHKAISLLVALYLDSPDVQHRTRAVTEAVHIGIVERCMRQLTCAGSRLRAFSDGTSSGEDEPMVIVASEDEIQAHRLCFSRSLMILKELVHGVRSRPKYSPQAPSQAPLPAISQDIKGNPIRIMYQYFGGGSGTPDIRTLEVGDLETIQDLSCRLVSLTGLSKFKLIAGGQVLDLIKLADQTLRDLKFNQKGLLLVQRELHADSEPKLASASGLRPAELEILGHFSELYQLLGMEEKFAREVGHECAHSLDGIQLIKSRFMSFSSHSRHTAISQRWSAQISPRLMMSFLRQPHTKFSTRYMRSSFVSFTTRRMYAATLFLVYGWVLTSNRVLQPRI